jgi:hypothetical protein
MVNMKALLQIYSEAATDFAHSLDARLARAATGPPSSPLLAAILGQLAIALNDNCCEPGPIF